MISFEGLPSFVKLKIKPDGYGARIRDSIFDKSFRLELGEGLFGALTIEFGERMKSGRSGNSRTMLRLVVYLKILVRWLYG